MLVPLALHTRRTAKRIQDPVLTSVHACSGGITLTQANSPQTAEATAMIYTDPFEEAKLILLIMGQSKIQRLSESRLLLALMQNIHPLRAARQHVGTSTSCVRDRPLSRVNKT